MPGSARPTASGWRPTQLCCRSRSPCGSSWMSRAEHSASTAVKEEGFGRGARHWVRKSTVPSLRFLPRSHMRAQCLILPRLLSLWRAGGSSRRPGSWGSDGLMHTGLQRLSGLACEARAESAKACGSSSTMATSKWRATPPALWLGRQGEHPCRLVWAREQAITRALQG